MYADESYACCDCCAYGVGLGRQEQVSVMIAHIIVRDTRNLPTLIGLASHDASIAFRGVTGDALEGVAERTFRRVPKRMREISNGRTSSRSARSAAACATPSGR